MRAAARAAASLDQPVGDQDDAVLGDFVAGDGLLPEEQVELSLRSQALAAALQALGDREREVLVLRYGLADYEPKTLEEIGRRLGLTRERVRQIEVEALRRLATLREIAARTLALGSSGGRGRARGRRLRSSRSARDSSWRTRSRVIPSSVPTSSSVCGGWPSRPKRQRDHQPHARVEPRERAGELATSACSPRSSPRAGRRCTSSIRSP